MTTQPSLKEPEGPPVPELEAAAARAAEDELAAERSVLETEKAVEESISAFARERAQQTFQQVCAAAGEMRRAALRGELFKHKIEPFDTFPTQVIEAAVIAQKAVVLESMQKVAIKTAAALRAKSKLFSAYKEACDLHVMLLAQNAIIASGGAVSYDTRRSVTAQIGHIANAMAADATLIENGLREHPIPQSMADFDWFNIDVWSYWESRVQQLGRAK